jgi:hypothetical protein
MGWRLSRRATSKPPEGACIPGLEHQGDPVTLATGEVVGHVCVHCMVRVVRPQNNARWFPYSDDGRPLPMLPIRY